MADNWITVPKNTNWDAVPQGITLTNNKKDYIRKLRQKEQEERVDVDTDGDVVFPARVKPNDISEVLKRKKPILK